MSESERFEKLKSALFAAGRDAVEDFLGYEYPDGEDKDVTDNRLDQAFEEMPQKTLEGFYQNYGV